MSFTREISIKELKNLRIGHAADEKAKTGVTVLYFPHGARVGCDISGGGPASRETPLTSPVTADNPVNAIVLSGGSAYGLAAADGVMRHLESQGIGYPTGNALVPLVCQSCIYDLGYGSADIRPDADLGEAACRQAMAKAGVTVEDIDLVEANEAFAAQSVAVARELHLDLDKVNVNGGAIAIGHPIGCSGARIIVTLLHEMLKREDAKKGLATLCIGGGMGVATVFEKC